MIVAAESVRQFSGHPGLVVQAFHRSQRELTAGAEPVEQELPMLVQGLGELDHRWDSRGRGGDDPAIQESSRPGRGFVLPEHRKVVFQQVRLYGRKIDSQQLAKTTPLLASEVGPTLHEYPSGMLERHIVSRLPELASLGAANLIDGVVAELRNVEPVENVNRLAGTASHGADERLPHVADYELKFRGVLRTEPVEERAERLGGPIASNPEQSSATLVQLIDQGEVLVPLLPRQLVDADCGDSVEVSVGFAPLDGEPHRSKDGSPARAEATRRLGPAQHLGPRRQEPREGSRHRRLAVAPRQQLDLDPASWAVAPSGPIDEVDRDSPERHELVAPLVEPVVRGTPASTTGTDWPTAPAGPNANIDPAACVPAMKPERSVNKTRVLLDEIQDSLELHRCWGLVVANRILARCTSSCLRLAHDPHIGLGSGARTPSSPASELRARRSRINRGSAVRERLRHHLRQRKAPHTPTDSWGEPRTGADTLPAPTDTCT